MEHFWYDILTTEECCKGKYLLGSGITTFLTSEYIKQKNLMFI